MRTAPGRTHSGRRPSPEVPRPDGINRHSPLKSKSTDTSRRRADPMRQLKHAKKSLRDIFRPSTAIETRIYTSRGRTAILKLHRRANKEIQKYHAARAIRSKTCSGCTNTIWLPPGRFSLSSFGRHVIIESEYVREGEVNFPSA